MPGAADPAAAAGDAPPGASAAAESTPEPAPAAPRPAAPGPELEPATPAEPAAALNGSHPEVGTHPPFPVARDATGSSGTTSTPAARGTADADEPEPLDLLSIAGGSIYKRAIPLLIGLIVIIAVIVWLIVR